MSGAVYGRYCWVSSGAVALVCNVCTTEHSKMYQTVWSDIVLVEARNHCNHDIQFSTDTSVHALWD